MKKILLLGLFFLTAGPLLAQNRVSKTIFQGFYWDYRNDSFPGQWTNYLCEMAPRLRKMGFDAIWLPPVYKNASNSSVGYSPFDHYDLGDKYQKGGTLITNRTQTGTKDELLRAIAVLHANGIEVVHDIVLNHTDGAGTRNGTGGVDPEPNFSTVTANGFKNFRYTSFATPLLTETQDDYFTRAGRWPKNYTNFYPNPSNNCTTGDICATLFGPDISYDLTATGLSTNIPANGTAQINGITRPYVNPPQPNNYMRIEARKWLQWFKRQTGGDGWRWDAIKHFPISVQEDLIYNSKYNHGDQFDGGQNMLCIGEWIGSKSELDAYVNNVRSGSAPNGINNEKHTGTFDFSLRGYSPSGGLYSMVLSQGAYPMQSLPAEQQNERFMDYPGGKRVYRTIPFVNSHDTYRPILTANGNFSQPLGNASGWNTSQELGGNGQHIDPREPRLATAYAVTMSMDGNPNVFIEDLFDLGTTGRRYSHLPSDTAALPERPDILNLLQAHQYLQFKQGTYAVPTALSAPDAPFFQKGSAANHLVIERTGRAIIGITDRFSAVANNSDDEEVYVTADPSFAGKLLYDYSGAHGIIPTQVFSDRRVLIKTAPVGHTISGARGHGYSIWAPLPNGVTVNSVQDLYNLLATFQPGRDNSTTQEWEMANDLGDSHCSSPGQGGALPANSTAQRTVGKIFPAAGTMVSIRIKTETSPSPLKWKVETNEGVLVAAGTGLAKPDTALHITFSNHEDQWLVLRIQYADLNQPGQRAFVQMQYVAPRVVNTRLSQSTPSLKKAIWTGSVNTDMTNCANWLEGKLPSLQADAEIRPSANMPVLTGFLYARNLFITDSARLIRMPGSVVYTQNIYSYGHIEGRGTIWILGDLNTRSLFYNHLSDTLYGEIVIDNPAGLAFRNTLVTDTLIFASGSLYADSGHVTARTFLNPGLTRYVKLNTSSTADLKVKTWPVNGTAFIPAGDSSNYTPVTLRFPASYTPSIPVSLRLLNRVHNQINRQTMNPADTMSRTDLVRRTWMIFPPDTTILYSVSLSWPAIIEGNLFQRNNALIHRYRIDSAGSKWQTVNTSVISGNNLYSVTAQGLINEAAFAVFSFNASLPVKFGPVKAIALHEKQARIQFSLSGIESGDRVSLEKSPDGHSFSFAAEVSGNQTSALDLQFNGKAFYRLRAEIASGRTLYSSIALAEWNGVFITLSPNPTRGQIFLQMNAAEAAKTWTASLYNADGSFLGKVRGNVQALNSGLSAVIEGKPAGVYTLQLSQNKKTISLQVQKQ